jgi:hypothetical protein
MDNIWIDLSRPGEQMWARSWDELMELADAVEASMKKKGRYGDDYADWTGGQNMRICFPCEQAWARYVDVQPNYGVGKADGGRDFTEPALVNVRGTPWWKKPHLLYPDNQGAPRPEVAYVLVGLHVEARRAVIRGWAPGDEFLREPLRQWPSPNGHQPTRVIPPERLRSVVELKRVPRQKEFFA